MPDNPPNPKQQFGDLKVPLGLFPSSAILCGSLAFSQGAAKYNAYNWRVDPIEAMTYVHAAERHLRAWMDGCELDADSGCPHLGHALACIAILIDAQVCDKLIDNRPIPAPFDELLKRWQKAPPPEDDRQQEARRWLNR